MIITKDMEQYIKLQRTGYGAADIASCYYKDIRKDYESIKAYLPEECNSILDIGCGIAGIDLFLYEHYNERAEINLFDYTHIDKSIYYGYHDNASVYNDLSLSVNFLELNGVKKDSINFYDAENGFFLKPYDIIISLLSCGFHYPVKTYLGQIKQCNPYITILDIRKNSGQIEMLRDNFKSVEVISTYSKCERVLIK